MAVVTVTDAKRRPARIPLIDGRHMTCPRCRKAHDILRYVPMAEVEEFKSETMPIYKCPSCRWLFAPVQDSNREVFDS